MTTTAGDLTIKDTSALTGLTPSVLRIWETRYGWPRPNRKANGYRTYPQGQIDELKRMAGFVQSGHAISEMIVDGLPKWPSEDAVIACARISQALGGPKPAGAVEAGLQAQLLDALEAHRTPAVRDLLQRIIWTVSPRDEAAIALAPTLVAMAELRALGRPLPGSADLTDQIKERCDQLLRMQRSAPDALLVVPARAGDDALARLTAILLCFRGIPAKPWTELREPTGPCIVVIDGAPMATRRRHEIGTVSSLRGDAGLTLIDLLDPAKPVAWRTAASA